ncbi:MAG: alkaline phosphatase family protein [Phycisphaerae bacterium]
MWLTPISPMGEVDRAYIGPGAGIALVGSCMGVTIAIFTALLMMIVWPFKWLFQFLRGRKTYAKAQFKRVVVLGLDGLEPTLAEQYMSEGIMPNLAKLRERGSYTRLGTTWPPLSPVAWSSFSTGTNPGKHNIYDFVSRTPDYRPMISSVRMREPKRKLSIGRFVIPLSSPEVTSLRKSKPFWNLLGDAGFFSAVIRVPITFPPDKFKGVQLSAMCVPDLRGTQGMFSYYSEQTEEGAIGDGDVGGDRIRVERRGSRVDSYLRGPSNSLRADNAEMKLPFRITEGGGGGAAATLHVGGESIPLLVGQFTDWVRVKFSAAPGIGVSGICRFMLKSFEKPFEMYCTPLQIDPDKPVMPIAHPPVYSSYLARNQGPFSTLGLAEDTWALSEKVFNEDDFIKQTYDIHQERETMFFDALEKVRRGLVVCVFDGSDRMQHMFWRFIDDQHPALPTEKRASHRNTLRDMYQRMDDLVGRTMAKLGEDTALFVMSDHGFKTFRRCVDLNAWLRDNGYLVLKDSKQIGTTPYLQDIDWSKTRAYAIGLAGIFLNLRAREAKGIVAPGEESKKLVAEICAKLTGVTDGAGGEVGVKEAVPREQVYKGPYVENAPDIIVGYNEGYRVSWDAAIGKCGEQVFSNNMKAWSGDHCVHPSLVPGVLFSTIKLSGENANIIDLAPTVLELFGVRKAEYMDGKSLLGGDAR